MSFVWLSLPLCQHLHVYPFHGSEGRLHAPTLVFVIPQKLSGVTSWALHSLCLPVDELFPWSTTNGEVQVESDKKHSQVDTWAFHCWPKISRRAKLLPETSPPSFLRVSLSQMLQKFHLFPHFRANSKMVPTELFFWYPVLGLYYSLQATSRNNLAKNLK